MDYCGFLDCGCLMNVCHTVYDHGPLRIGLTEDLNHRFGLQLSLWQDLRSPILSIVSYRFRVWSFESLLFQFRSLQLYCWWSRSAESFLRLFEDFNFSISMRSVWTGLSTRSVWELLAATWWTLLVIGALECMMGQYCDVRQQGKTRAQQPELGLQPQLTVSFFTVPTVMWSFSNTQWN